MQCISVSQFCMKRLISCVHGVKTKASLLARTPRRDSACRQIKTLSTWCCVFGARVFNGQQITTPRSIISRRQGQCNITDCNPFIYNYYRSLFSQELSVLITAPNKTKNVNLGLPQSLYVKNTQFSDFHTHTCVYSKDDEHSQFHIDPEIKSLVQQITQDFADEHTETVQRESENPDSDSLPTSESSDGVSANFSVDTDSVLSSVKEDHIGDDETVEVFDDNVEVEYDDIYEKQVSISLERGKSGVYDIEEMVELLREENAEDLCVIQVPPEKKYADYLVIATGRSVRHLRSMAKNIQWIFKKKRQSGDPRTIKIEGLDCPDWLALDIGNMVVHLFLSETRELYDLEILWTVGEEFDDKSQTDSVDMMKSWVSQDRSQPSYF